MAAIHVHIFYHRTFKLRADISLVLGKALLSSRRRNVRIVCDLSESMPLAPGRPATYLNPRSIISGFLRHSKTAWDKNIYLTLVSCHQSPHIWLCWPCMSLEMFTRCLRRCRRLVWKSYSSLLIIVIKNVASTYLTSDLVDLPATSFYAQERVKHLHELNHFTLLVTTPYASSIAYRAPRGWHANAESCQWSSVFPKTIPERK